MPNDLREPNRVPLEIAAVSALLVAVTLAAAVPLAAQQPSDAQQPQQAEQQPETQQESTGQEPTEQEQFAQRFWEFLQKADYRQNWSRWPGHEGFTEGRQGQDPHGDVVKIYVNPKAESSLENPVAESVIVKENYNDEKELVSITPMYRVDADYDPPNKNWYWAMYRPDGTLFASEEKKLAGRLKNCIECHVSAEGRDYVFNNDPVDQ